MELPSPPARLACVLPRPFWFQAHVHPRRASPIRQRQRPPGSDGGDLVSHSIPPARHSPPPRDRKAAAGERARSRRASDRSSSELLSLFPFGLSTMGSACAQNRLAAPVCVPRRHAHRTGDLRLRCVLHEGACQIRRPAVDRTRTEMSPQERSAPCWLPQAYFTLHALPAVPIDLRLEPRRPAPRYNSDRIIIGERLGAG